MKAKTLLLSQTDVASLLSLEDVLVAIEDALRAHGEERVRLPAKVSLDLGEGGDWPHHNAFLNAMPAYLGNIERAGIKWAGAFWDNRTLGLPSVMALIIINDPVRGFPLAVIDGGWITAYRTAAVSAVGAKYMARRPVRSVAILGAGTQGRTHLLAFDALLNPAEYHIYDVDRDTVDDYYAQMAPRTEARIERSSSVRACTADADVVVTATPAQEPFLHADSLKPGAHVCAIGSYTEIAYDVVEWAERIVVDDRHQISHRGNLARFYATAQISDEDVAAELGEIVAGNMPGRTYDAQNTLLVPIGMGSEDLAVAHAAYTRALESGVGQWFDFRCEEKPIQ
jgi:ornithine cyclodeaminase/alanine dehydrogenase-like protein (mu-crystallin family)